MNGRYLSFSVFLVSLVFSLHFGSNFVAPKLLLLRLLLLLGLLLLALKWKRKSSISFKPSFLFLFAFCFIGIVLFRSLFSPIPFPAQSKTLEYLSWFAFLFLCTLIHEEGKWNTTFTLLEISAIPILFYGFLQHFGLDPIHWTPGGKRIFSTLGGADWFAGYIAVLLSLSAVRFLEKPALSRFLLLESEFLGIYWSYTRAPFPALLLAGLFLVGFLLSQKSLQTFLKPCGLLFFSFALTFFLLHFSSRSNPLSTRYNPLTWKQDLNITARGYLFSKGLQVFAVHFWTGAGPGNFPTAYLPYRSGDPLFARLRGRAESTHNTFLDVGAETGIFGEVFFLAVWISGFILLLKGIKSCTQDEIFRRLTCLAPLFVSFLCLQFIYPDVALEALTAFLLGISPFLISPKTVTISLEPRVAWELFALTVLLVIPVEIYSIRWATADVYNGKGLHSLEKKDWKIAVQNFSSAVRWNPKDPVLYRNLGKAYEGAENPARALLYYNTSLSLNSREPYTWADLGRLAGKHHWKTRAFTAYAKAMQLDPYNPIWYHEAAVTALSFHFSKLARYFFREAYWLGSRKGSMERKIKRR